MNKINGRTVENIKAKELKVGDTIYEHRGVLETILKVINIEKSKVKNLSIGRRSIDAVVIEKGQKEERYFGFHPNDRLMRLITIKNVLEKL